MCTLTTTHAHSTSTQYTRFNLLWRRSVKIASRCSVATSAPSRECGTNIKLRRKGTLHTVRTFFPANRQPATCNPAGCCCHASSASHPSCRASLPACSLLSCTGSVWCDSQSTTRAMVHQAGGTTSGERTSSSSQLSAGWIRNTDLYRATGGRELRQADRHKVLGELSQVRPRLSRGRQKDRKARGVSRISPAIFPLSATIRC